MPFYYEVRETSSRIVFIYEAGRQILPRDFRSDTTLLRELPVVLVSERPAEEVLGAVLLSQVNLRPVEVFNTDPNESQLGRRRSIFIREITILEKK